jgi:hypothetical protein
LLAHYLANLPADDSSVVHLFTQGPYWCFVYIAIDCDAWH